jgi:hypothetical protein
MMRIVVILAAIAAFGHHVSSRPQNLPLNPPSILGGGSNKNNSAPFGCNPANLVKPDFTGFISLLVNGIQGGQAQATAAPEAATEASSARKKRNPAAFPFQEVVPTRIQSNWLPEKISGEQTLSDAKPNGD